MRFQRKQKENLSLNECSRKKMGHSYKVVIKFIQPPTEEERIERQNRIAAVMIKNAISLAKKDRSLVDNRNVR